MLKVMAGVLLAMVVIVIGGTAAFAAGPDPDKASCMAFCNPNGPNGIYCGLGANNIAQGLLPLGGPGASGHAQLTLTEVYALFAQ